MTDRTTISVPEAVAEEARDAKGDRTWADLVLDGAAAPGARHDGVDGRRDEGQDDTHPTPLTADDVPMLAREVADEVENRMTRR